MGCILFTVCGDQCVVYGYIVEKCCYMSQKCLTDFSKFNQLDYKRVPTYYSMTCDIQKMVNKYTKLDYLINVHYLQ